MLAFLTTCVRYGTRSPTVHLLFTSRRHRGLRRRFIVCGCPNRAVLPCGHPKLESPFTYMHMLLVAVCISRAGHVATAYIYMQVYMPEPGPLWWDGVLGVCCVCRCRSCSSKRLELNVVVRILMQYHSHSFRTFSKTAHDMSILGNNVVGHGLCIGLIVLGRVLRLHRRGRRRAKCMGMWLIGCGLLSSTPTPPQRTAGLRAPAKGAQCGVCFSSVVRSLHFCHLTLALPPVSPPPLPPTSKRRSPAAPSQASKPVCTPREARPTLELAWHATQNIASVNSPDELARPSTETSCSSRH